MKKLLLLLLTALIMGGLFAAPLNESFTGTVFPPAGWTVHNVDGGQAWVRYTNTYYSGPASASIRYDDSAHDDWLVTPRLTPSAANHTLSFWAYSTSSSYPETFKVWISTTGNAVIDFTTQLGPEVTAPNTWTQYQYDLSTYIGSEVYVAVQATGEDQLRLAVDDFTGVDLYLYPEPSNHVTGFAPTPGYTTVKLDWTGSTGTQQPTGYLIQAIKVGAGSYAAVADGTPVADDSDWSDGNAAVNVSHVVGDNTYTFTGLSEVTAYEFKIWPYSNDGTDIDFKVDAPIPTVSATTLDPTISAPWLEDFGSTGATFPPANWTRGNGLLADPSNITSGSYWVRGDWLNDTTVSPVNWSARMNVYGTNRGGWLITPPIQMPGTGYQLELDIGLTDWNSTDPITSDPNGTTGVDDKFIILIGDGVTWSPANILRQYDNAGSPYVYNDISHTGNHLILPLDSYTGIQHIAFYAESTVGNADNDFFVDNVQICQTPASAVFTIAPELTSWDFGMVPAGASAEKEFAVTNTGSGTLTVSSITQTGTNPPFSIVPTSALPWSLTNADPAKTFKVVFSPQTAGGPFSTDVTITYNDGTQATYTISFTGSAYAPATLPLTEGWENGQGTWIFVNGTQTNAWYIGAGDATYGPYEGDNFAYISNDNGNTVAYTTSSASVTHIYKDIAFDANCLEFPLSFQWRCRGEGTAWDRMRVYLVDTSVNPVAGTELTSGQIGLTNYNVQPAWTAETITLPGELSGTVKRLVFSWRNDSSSGSNPPINLDNISLTAVPVPSGPVVAPNLDYPADRQTDLPKTGFSFQFSWNMAGSEPDTYNLYLANLAELGTGYSTDDFFAAAIAYEDISSPYNPLFTYVYGETYVWTVVGFSAAYPDEVYQWPPYEFTIEPDPTITLPHTQNFGTDATPVWPLGWTQTYSGGVTSDRWTVSASTNAGGTVNEMKCSWYNATGVSRLITPPIDTNGIPMFTASFNQYYSDFGAGVTAKLQYSHDLNTWYDTDYAIISGSGSIGAYETVTISGLNAPVTYLAWVMDGNHYQFNFWYVDDVYLAVPYNLDAKAVSIDMYQVVEPLAFTPMATVGNNGTQTISFNVTITIGGTTLPAQSVTALAPGATQQLSFGSFTPVANTFYDVTVTTNLAGDENPANDTITGQFVCIELNKTAYGDVCFDPGNILDGPATFSLRDPGTITDLPEPNPFTRFLAGADWIDGGWWGVENYNESYPTSGKWWQIDTTTGAGTINGDVGLYLSGVAWDPVADVVYGVNANSLYTLDKLTGAPTLIGQLTWGGAAFNGRLVDIAWNNYNSTLYALDLGYDAVFTIDPVTLAVTPLGYTVGYDLEYAQGMAFDQDTGFLYLAASTDDDGFLLWVNTNQPDADGYMGETYYVGRLQRGCEVDGFVIPYPQLAIPDLTIALESGVPTLSWNSIVGATAYNVYGSNDPYADDPWTLLAATPNTTYAYTGNEPYHFFKVTAFTGLATARTQFSGLDRVRQVFQPTRVQYNRDIQPQATGTRASKTKPVK